MEFCKKCKSLMLPNKSGTGLVCPSCGSRSKPEGNLKLKEKLKRDKHTAKRATKEVKDTMPTTHEECEKCGNKEAFWWTEQTRSTDEPETQFFRCTKCRYTWRKYS